MADRELVVATFNTEWRESASEDAEFIRAQLATADIVCLTEAYQDFFGTEGYTIDAPFAVQGSQTDRRKVLLWSRQPWRDIDEGSDALLGYYLGATTQTDLGPIRVHGLVIPYRFSGVRYGTPKRKVWELHQAYLRALGGVLPREPHRTIALGDFNQRIPRKYQPQHMLDQLQQVILDRLKLATGGIISGVGKQAIDHICHSHDLDLLSVEALTNVAPDGHLVSDHFGLRASLRR